MSDDTNILLTELIKGQNELNGKFGSLTDEITKLVSIEAGRVEREKIQQTKNDEFKEFIDENKYPLIRLKKWQDDLDKSRGKIIFIVIVAVGVASGFNWLG